VITNPRRKKELDTGRLSPQGFDELFDGHTCVSDEGAQESGLQFTMVRHCEWQAGIGRMP
jgi:hypothetical protein